MAASNPNAKKSKLAFLRNTLPWLGTIAGIAVPGAAPFISVASKIVSAKLNKQIPATSDDLTDALSDALGDPAQHAALLEAEQAFQETMQQMKFKNVEDVLQIETDDRADARAMEVADKSWFPHALASVVTVGFFLTLWIVFVRGVAPPMHDIAIGMVNVLGTAWVGVIGFYFGASHSQGQQLMSALNGNGQSSPK